MALHDVAAGIDIGGTNTEIGIVDEGGICLARTTLSTGAYKSAEMFVREVHAHLHQLLDAITPARRLKGIGIGAPNGNYYRGTIEFAPNLPWRGVVPMVEMLKAIEDIPVVLTNDANAAALGEMLYGAARGMRDVIVITLGTGLGSGIVVDGKLVHGHSGFAGEIGHTIVDPDGRECGCGRRGCLETYVSAPGLKRTVSELLAHRTAPSSLRGFSFDELSAVHITQAARAGDGIALEAFDRTAKVLAMKLADAVAHTSPEAIVLFGGLAQAGEVLLEPTRRWLEQYLLNVFKNTVRLLPSSLKDDGGVLGAAALMWNHLSTSQS